MSAAGRLLAHEIDSLEELAAVEGSGRSARDLLDKWRAAERALAEAPVGSIEAADALLRARDLRTAYHRAFRDARREDAED
jgi:hypothetical protein